MNRTELVAAIAEKSGLPKAACDKVLAAVLESTKDALAAGEKVQLVGVGTFEVKARAAREGRNPRTGEVVKIAASKAPAFRPGSALKDSIQ